MQISGNPWLPCRETRHTGIDGKSQKLAAVVRARPAVSGGRGELAFARSGCVLAWPDISGAWARLPRVGRRRQRIHRFHDVVRRAHPGHAHPKLTELVSRTMAEGSHFAAATSAEVEAAERLRSMVPSAEVVRFANTGSEATMLALRLARAHTGRTKFLKFEGHYHGWYDPYLLNAHSHAPEQLGPPENPARLPDSEGIPASTFDDVVLAPWNDVAALERVMRQHGRELAAVITEPIMANMGCIPPRDGYLKKASRNHAGLRRTADPGRSGHRLPLRPGRMPGVLRSPAGHQHLRQGSGRGISGGRSGRAAIHSRSPALERAHGAALWHLQRAPAHHESCGRQP